MGSLHDSRLHKWVATSPPVTWTVRRLRELLIGALKQGPVPQHVAFVMDGNRRFARSHHIETVEGHNLGFESLARILEVCYRAGVRVVTIYAFSIENFKRSQHEVDALMAMAKVKLQQLAEHGALLDRYGAAIRVLGQRNLVQPDVLAAVDKAVAMTAHNTHAVLNVCFPYTARHEITAAVMHTVDTYGTPLLHPPPPANRTFSESHIAHHIRKQMCDDADNDTDCGAEQPNTPQSTAAYCAKDMAHVDDCRSSSAATIVNPSDREQSPGCPAYLDPEVICAQTLTDNMMTAGAPPLDLLVRTSGVERLSDFMLWQCHQDTSIVFLKCLWPDFDLWQFLPVLFEWQWKQKKSREEQYRGLAPFK